MRAQALHRARAWAREARRSADLVRLGRGNRDWAVYIGNTGRSNLGDDLLHACVERVVGLPTAALPESRKAAAALTRRIDRPPTAIVLGGGTLVGRFRWLERLQRPTQAWPDARRLAVGVGVEDPGFENGAELTTAAELTRWSRELAAFDLVSVRGPNSADLLRANCGVQASIAGDPGLLAAEFHEGPRTASEAVIGLNLASVGPMWGDQEAMRAVVVQGVAAAAREAKASVLLFAMHPADQSELDAAAGALASADVATSSLDAPDFRALISSLGRATHVVSQRLHGYVIARSLGIPATGLAYRPKFHDFESALDAGGRGLFRTDECTADGIATRISETSRVGITYQAPGTALHVGFADVRADVQRVLQATR